MTTQVKKEYTQEELNAIMRQYGLAPKKKTGPQKPVITVNKKKGLYFKHPDFKAWSDAKQKEYTEGFNMSMATAKALFNNEEFLAQLRDFVNNDELQAKVYAEKLAKIAAKAEA